MLSSKAFGIIVPPLWLLGALLAGAAPPATQEAPDPGSLAHRVLTRLRGDREALQRFRWVETAVLEKRVRDGSVRDRTIEVNEITFRDGRRYERPLSIDMSEDAEGFSVMRQEESRFLRNQNPSGEEAREAEDSPLRAERLLECFELEPLGVELLDDTPSLKVHFAPIPGCLTDGGRATRLLQRLSGTIWLDEESADIRRLEGRLHTPVSFGFGIFGKIDSFEIDFDRASVAPGVWSLVRAAYRARGRWFLFSRFDVRSTRFRSAFELDTAAGGDPPSADRATAVGQATGGAGSLR